MSLTPRSDYQNKLKELKMKQKIAEYAKFIAAVLGLAATSFAFAVPADVAPWVAATVAFLTALAVLLVPNAAKPGTDAS